MQPDDDDAWRSIVDNYGERVDLEPEIGPEPPPAPPPSAGPASGRARSDATRGSSWEDPYPDADWAEERFVPPPAPPVPTATRDRRIAWIALLGAPTLLVALLLVRLEPPQPVVLVLVAAFVGGFLYLVVTMSGEPRDPGDDGARL